MPKAKAKFDPQVFLATLDGDRTISHYEKDAVVFTQGQPADAIFYIQSGKIKILVTSGEGKEAVVAMLGTGDFFGEGCLIGQPLRLASASAITECTITRIEKAAMIRVVQQEPLFAEKFMHHLLTRNTRKPPSGSNSIHEIKHDARLPAHGAARSRGHTADHPTGTHWFWRPCPSQGAAVPDRRRSSVLR